ncbi:MAG TPA: hypothetical protein VHS79_10540 [Actinomycetes bacterium]|nr:hypothetical protein [Actinomycetes bacterium]
MLAAGVLAFLAAAAGILVPATHTTRTTADEPQYLLTAISLATDGDLDIADELADGRWRPFHALPLPTQTEPLADGRRLSPHNPLLPLLLAGPVAAGGWVGAKLAMAVMAGLLAALLVWTAVRRLEVPVGTAALAVAVLACSPPLAVYGSQVYPELPAALAVLAAAAALTAPAVPSVRATLVVGVAVVALPWLGVKYAPVAAAITLVACWRLVREGRVRRALALPGRWPWPGSSSSPCTAGGTGAGPRTRPATTSSPESCRWSAPTPSTWAAAAAWSACWSTGASGWPPGSRPGCWPSRPWPPWPGAARPAGPPSPCPLAPAGWSPPSSP